MIKHRPKTKRHRRWRGFTLVEVLLALGLMMLVLAASYGALNLFQRVTVSGRNEAERAQLIRAIERRIAADIRCVIYQETKEPAASSTEGSETDQSRVASLTPGLGAADDSGTSSMSTGSSGATATATEPVLITPPTEAYATQTMGVFGDATTLVLHVSKPARPAVLPPDTSNLALVGVLPAPRPTDLRSISYYLAGSDVGGFGTPFSGVPAMLSTDANNIQTQLSQGLARLDGDRLAIQQAELAGGVNALAQQATLLAPEVTELQFRYFDGTTWYTEWDSVVMKSVPRAIEVTLRLDTSVDDPMPTTPSPFARSTSDIYRFVVALPLADPTQGTAL